VAVSKDELGEAGVLQRSCARRVGCRHGLGAGRVGGFRGGFRGLPRFTWENGLRPTVKLVYGSNSLREWRVVPTALCSSCFPEKLYPRQKCPDTRRAHVTGACYLRPSMETSRAV
jgi:hypothetical protein